MLKEPFQSAHTRDAPVVRLNMQDPPLLATRRSSHVVGDCMGVRSNTSPSPHFVLCFGLTGNTNALCYCKENQ